MPYLLKTSYAHRSNYGAYRDTSKIKYIVWHYTANDGDTDEANAKFFRSPNRKASANYFVDDDSVTVSVPDTYVPYSVGGSRYSNYRATGGAKLYRICTNANSVNIELCDTVKNGKYDVSEKTLQNAIELTRSLMMDYHIPVTHVIRHFDVTGKSCPAYYVDDRKWNAVKDRLLAAAPAFSSETDYSLIFDASYYSGRYPDLKSAFGTAPDLLLRHFITNGMKEGRQASPAFDVYTYQKNYADLRAAFGGDLEKYYYHYITNGFKEKRKAV